LYNSWFPFLEPHKERLHSYQAYLFTQPSDNASGGLVTSLIYVVRCFFQNNRQKLVEDQRSWGLHRPPSTVCLGTGRPVRQFGDLGTAPTIEYCMLGDWSPSPPVWRSRDCTDHRVLYARGLVTQPTSLEIWGLHRPSSTVCSRTGHPVRQFGDLGTATTTEHCMLGDWSPGPPVWGSGGCTDHRALYARGLLDQHGSLEELGTIPITKALSARD